MKQFSSCLVLVSLLLTSWAGLAQNYPVQVQAIARPPYSNYLADLTNPASEQLTVTLLLRDLQLTNRQVRLQTYIEGPGGRIQGQSTVSAPPINLLPGSMIQLSGAELATYFRPENLQIPAAQYGRALPEGLYRFCFTVFDFQTNQQLSATACSNMAWIQRSDPPLLMQPTINQLVPATPAQQVVFQWTPRHSQVNAVDYELAITEIIIPQGFNANLQNLFLAQPPYFTVRTTGNTYLYGPSNPPLTKGRTYGYRVRAVPKPGSEGQTAFTNDGYSQVGFFVYGGDNFYSQYAAMSSVLVNQQKYAPSAPPDNIAKSMKGRVAWTFKKTELEPDTAKSAWVVDAPAKAWRETYQEVNVPAEKSSVANPLENAQVTITANGKLIGSAKTDKEGNYEIRGFNPDVLQGVTSLTVRATMSSDFMTVTRTVAIQRGQAQYDLGQSLLIAHTFRLATQVIASGMPNEDISLRVLRRKDIVDRLTYLKQEGTGSREDVSYNGQTYVSVATVTSSQAARRIFYNTIGGDQFVVQVLVRNKAPMYVPLSAFNTQAKPDGNKPVLYVKRNFIYKSSITLAGKVGTQNPAFTGREGVRIVVTVRGQDMATAMAGPVSGTMVGFTKTVTSDKNGQYTIAEIPMLKKGAKIRVDVTDNTLSPVTLTETVPFTGSEFIGKDITLKATMSLVTGIVNDQYDKPVKGALVKEQGSGQVVRTNEYGYFIMKSFKTGPIKLTFAGNALADSTTSFTPNRFSWKQTNTDENSNLWERTLANYASTRALLRTAEKTTLTPELLGYPDESLTQVFNRLRLPYEELAGMVDAGVVTLKNKQGLIRFVTTLDQKPVAAQIELSTGKTGETADGKSWDYLTEPDLISYTVRPVEGGLTFLPAKGEVSVEASAAITITLALEQGVLLKGTITDDSTDAPLADATIEVKGLPYKTTTEKDGTYSLGVPIGREISLRISADDYESVDSTLTLSDSGTFDLALAASDSSLPEVKTLMGFEVKITNIEKADDEKFTISGTLIPTKDGAFRGDDDTKLTFSDVEVEVDDEGNAIPSDDVEFEEIELNVKAFGFAPVLVESKRGLRLQAMVSDEESGMIGGDRLVLATDRIKMNRGFDLALLPKTTLELIAPEAGDKKEKAPAINEEPELAPVFVTPEVPLLATSMTARYKLDFGKFKVLNIRLTPAEQKQLSIDSEKYLLQSMTFMTFLFDREKCELNSRGFDFVGKARLAKAAGITWVTKDIVIDTFSIGKRFELRKLVFRISKNTPLVATMGKWRARLDKVTIQDDFKVVGFGGSIGSTNNRKNDFKILDLNFGKSGDGIMLAGRISLPDDGYKIGAMGLTTPNGFAISYVSKDRFFEIDGSAKLTYKGGNKNSVFKAFPMEVQRFTYRTNNQFFVAVKANIQLALGPVKVNLTSFVFNRGVGMTLDQMSGYLALAEKEVAKLTATDRFDKTLAKAAEADSAKAAKVSIAKESVSGALDRMAGFGEEEEEEEEVMVEEKVAWGIGFAGGIDINVQSLEAASAASVVLVDDNGSIKMKVGDFKFVINGPQFKADIEASLDDSEERSGFAGKGSLELVSRKFGCSFKYYKKGPGDMDIEFGLGLVVSTTIPMGSVMWTALGGEVSFDLKDKKYAVKLTGELTPIGDSQKTLLCKDVSLAVLFDTKNCGKNPVIQGTASMTFKGQPWGTIKATLDFCKPELLITVDGNVEVLKGLGNLTVKGILYAGKRTRMETKYEAKFETIGVFSVPLGIRATGTQEVTKFIAFFGVNATLSVPNLGNANAAIAVGINSQAGDSREIADFYKTSISPKALTGVEYINNDLVIGSAFYSQTIKRPPTIVIGEKAGLNGISVKANMTASFGGEGSVDLLIVEPYWKYWTNATANAGFYLRFDNGDFGFNASLSVSAGAKLGARYIGELTAWGGGWFDIEGGYNNNQGWHGRGEGGLEFGITNDSRRDCNTANIWGKYKVCIRTTGKFSFQTR